LRNNYTDKYLGLDRSFDNGVRVVASDNAFKWDIWNLKVDSGVNTYRYTVSSSSCPIKITQFSVRIGVPNTPFVLDLMNFGDSMSGTPITLWQDTGAPQQRWEFESGTSDYFLYEIFWTAGSF
jgi:hypothetical protein